MNGAELGGLPEAFARDGMAPEGRLAAEAAPREPDAPRDAGEFGRAALATSPAAS